MFYNFPVDFKEFEPAPGFSVRIVSGQNLMLSHFTLKSNSGAPLHHHIEEQMGIILEGELEMTIGDKTKFIKSGDMYFVSSDTPHSSLSAKGASGLDIFSPPREAYK